MKRNLLPWQLLTLAALLAPSLYLAYLWPQLPAQIPTHFGPDGQANCYTDRAHVWLLTLGLPLGTTLFFGALPYFDPKRRLDAGSVNFQKLRLTLVLLLGGVAAYCLHAAAHPGATPGRGLVLLQGLFFVLLGNYLTTVPPNYFVGIRTPWALESPTVWARTHRVGGIAFCLVGLLVAGLALLLPTQCIHLALLVPVLLTAVFCYAYSFVLFRQEERLRNPA